MQVLHEVQVRTFRLLALTGCVIFLALEVFFHGGRPSHDRIKLSKRVPASSAALRVRRRVDDAMEGSFTVALLSEWMKDDVDHSELIVSRVDDVIHSALFLTRVGFVFGSGLHNLAKHMLVRVSRTAEFE